MVDVNLRQTRRFSLPEKSVEWHSKMGGLRSVARIAEALEILYADQARAHAAELAHHFAEAESILGPDQLIRYSLLAARWGSCALCLRLGRGTGSL